MPSSRPSPQPAAPIVSPAPSGLWIAAMPAIFVLIWSSGFVVAKFGLPYATPLWFLVLRFAVVIAVLLMMLPFMRVNWPSRAQSLHIAVAGTLIQAGYLGGVWCAIDAGMPAGLAALIVGLQPILTAFVAPAIGERVTARQWAGFALGFAGVSLVVANKIAVIALPMISVAFAVIALLSITSGTLYQKRKCPSFDLRAGSLIQFTASLAIALPLALIFERWSVRFTPEFIGALMWSALVLSIGGMSLLFPLIRRVTALMAWIAFGERFTSLAMAGMVAAVIGVALVVIRPR